MAAFDAISSEIAKFTKTMHNLNYTLVRDFNQNNDRFLEKSQNLSYETSKQGWGTFGITVLSAGSGIFGATGNGRWNKTAETLSKFFGGMNGVWEPWSRSETTKIESKRASIQQLLQGSEQLRSALLQAAQQANQAISRVLDSMAKGG